MTGTIHDPMVFKEIYVILNFSIDSEDKPIDELNEISEVTLG